MIDWIWFDGIYIRSSSIDAFRTVDKTIISIMAGHMCYTQTFKSEEDQLLRFHELQQELGVDD